MSKTENLQKKSPVPYAELLTMKIYYPSLSAEAIAKENSPKPFCSGYCIASQGRATPVSHFLQSP